MGGCGSEQQQHLVDTTNKQVSASQVPGPPPVLVNMAISVQNNDSMLLECISKVLLFNKIGPNNMFIVVFD